MILVELGLYVLVAVAGSLGGWAALQGTLTAAAARGAKGDASLLLDQGQAALGWWVGGIALVALARAIASRRSGNHVQAPWLLPSAFAASGLGLAVQLGYGNPFRADWPGPGFAFGVFLGGLITAGIVLFPWDPARLLSRAHLAVGGLVVGLFGALALFGQAPAGTDQRINLGPVQPIEAVKILAVAFLAEELGRRAGKLRWQRGKVGFLRFPRPVVLLPAVGTLLVSLAGLFLVKDLGPTLILAGVFLGLFYIVTRSPGWIATALGTVGAMLAVFAVRPEWALSSTVETRLRMWLDPWMNGIAHGDQLASALWALAAGGIGGVGLGAGEPGALPAGHTDLVYAHLVEEMGLVGGALYLGLLGAVIAGVLYVAARNRTPERVLLAAGLGLLLAFQALTILGGTLGALPLTGVVVPFLSFGKSSMAAFLALAGLAARLGEDGEARSMTDDLHELRLGVRGAGLVLATLAVALLGLTALPAAILRDETTLRPAVTTLADGTPALLTDPRLSAIARRMRRGSILDRAGQPLAVSPGPGTRIHPLGDALGTVLGPAEGDLLRAPWSIERIEDEHLRGYPTLPDGPAIWLAKVDGHERLILAVPSALETDAGERAEVDRRMARRGATGEPRRLPLTTPDYRPLLSIARMPLELREPAIEALSADIASRSVTLTLDARLQARATAAVRAAAKASRLGVAALVILDPANGQVLARAQWPDFDPGNDAWRASRLSNDPKFMGVYGPWADKTGSHGIYQAGSSFKVLTALAAIRAGLVGDVKQPDDATCPTSAGPTFPCNQVDDGKPSFTLPGWSRPIHDHGDGGAHGNLDLIAGITKSSNVYFGQLALKLGSDPYRELRTMGVEFGNPGLLDEADTAYTGLGTAGSRRLAQTGFGQGAGSWNVTEAARLVGAVANGGTYWRCPAEMTLDAPCASIGLLTPGTSLAPLLAGMKGVMETGTGKRLAAVPGVRVYGKTGTADAPGTRAESPWGIRAGATTSPHSWFVAIAEPADAPACADGTASGGTAATATAPRTTAPGPKRYVVAGVVPHGGFGATAAGPMVMDAIAGLTELGFFQP